jgi:hypothetical protein
MRVRNLVLGPLLLALAGCGASADGDGVATAGGPASSTATSGENSERESVLAYSECMRDNGIPDFPDPEFGDDGEARLSAPEGMDRATVEAADKKCKRLLPNGGQPVPPDPEMIAKTRAYAKCMRDNGLPSFPDPGADGGIQIEGGPGLDPASQEFKAAEEKCRVHLPDGGKGGSTNQESEK